MTGERGGSVVECRTPEWEVRGSRPTAAVLCPWARHFTPRKYWLITQEAMAPSRHDWKIVDWDVKPQHNQPTTYKTLLSNRNIRLFANVLLLLGNHRLNWIWYGLAISNEPPHKTNKMTCTPGDDSDEPGRPPSLIRVSADRMNKLPIERLAKTLIRLNGCSGWSESSLGSHSDCWFCPGAAKIILFVYKFHI